MATVDDCRAALHKLAATLDEHAAEAKNRVDIASELKALCKHSDAGVKIEKSADAPSFEKISACVHCGLCLEACPTYKELRVEMDSPRGRIYLMKGILDDPRHPPCRNGFGCGPSRCRRRRGRQGPPGRSWGRNTRKQSWLR